MQGAGSRGNAQLGPPDRGKGASSRATRGRVCEEPGCSTILSTYNSDTTCWAHAQPTYRHPLFRGRPA